jgi:hypothetical protein
MFNTKAWNNKTLKHSVLLLPDYSNSLVFAHRSWYWDFLQRHFIHLLVATLMS